MTNANMTDTAKIHVGDILEGDFGWSMTLPAFYLVTSITASGKSARVRRLNTLNESSDGGWTGTCIPDKNSFREEKEQLCRIKTSHYRHDEPYEYVTIRDHSFRVWDNEPAYFDHWD